MGGWVGGRKGGWVDVRWRVYEGRREGVHVKESRCVCVCGREGCKGEGNGGCI